MMFSKKENYRARRRIYGLQTLGLRQELTVEGYEETLLGQ
jgi:hypothetical protein